MSEHRAESEHRSREPRRSRPSSWVAAFVLLTLVLSYWHTGIDAGALFDEQGWQSFSEMLGGLTSPDLSRTFLARIGTLALESLLIGLLGTAMAIVLAIGLAIASARLPQLAHDPARTRTQTFGGALIRACARAVLACFRAIPEILWAFLFVRIFGLGPAPAVFAIAITFSGTVGKLFAELIESIDPLPAQRLRAAGASRVAVFLYGVLPLVRKQWVAYALFRLECAIRSASILGVVGAGGLGMEIDLSIRYFQYDKLATALLAVLAYVLVLEAISHVLRKTRPLVSVACMALGALAGILWIRIPWSELFNPTSLDQLRTFLSGFSSITSDGEFLWTATKLAMITVSMAWVSTVVAAAVALLLAPMAITRFTIRGYLQDAPEGRGLGRWAFLAVLVPARTSLQIARALPELVWALLFILWVGPGVTAGVLALTVHTVGILGRLYSDVLEETEPGPPRALEAMGAGPVARYVYGVLPQSMPRILAFTLFRFEVNVRAAAMVGFVGAGGLGDALHTAISLFHMRDLASLLVLTLCLVLLVDTIGDHVRARVLRGSR